MEAMTILMPELTGYGGIRHIAVSLPYVPALLDGKKYMEPQDVPRLQGTELYRARAPRGLTLRSLVRLALKCDSAEQGDSSASSAATESSPTARARPRPSSTTNSTGCWYTTD